jgi:tRNA threonylcarbamoyladenosine biosynthesis protein TsaE
MQQQPPFTAITTLGQLGQTVQSLVAYAKGYSVWTFHGPLGAGKTTFIKAICHHLGITTPVTSPTFSLIHTYHLLNGASVYHMDAYRIEQVEEAEAMDYPFYFESGVYTFIEWPEKIQSFLPPCYLAVRLLPHDTPSNRQLTAHRVTPLSPLPLNDSMPYDKID